MQSRFRVLAVGLFVVGSASACITMPGVAKTRASNDFKCSEEQITVVNIGGSSYRATGCGQEATYNCIQSSEATLACAREEQHTTTKLTSAQQ